MKKILFLSICLLHVLLLPFAGGRAEASDFGERVSGMAEITGLRVSVQDDKVRIVVDADGEVSFKTSALSNPGRILVDLPNTWLSPKVGKNTQIDSEYAKRVRVAQHDKTTVRIVVESDMGKGRYRVFNLSGNRVVMDFGKVDDAAESADVSENTPANTDDSVVPEGVPKLDPEDKINIAKYEETDEGDADAVDVQIANLTGLKGRSITIDPGHGGSDSGAIGPSGLMEKTVTLNVAMEVKRLLEAEGATVYMTRTTDTEVSPKKAHATDIEELQARCDIANRKKSDIFISIHMDSFSSETATGTTGYYYEKGSKKSFELADKVRAGLIEQIRTKNRGTRTCNFYVVRHTDMPATLVEVAFISNRREEALLNSKAGILKAAQGIVDGIADYFG